MHIKHAYTLEEALENAGENVYKAAFRLARSIQLTVIPDGISVIF